MKINSISHTMPISINKNQKQNNSALPNQTNSQNSNFGAWIRNIDPIVLKNYKSSIMNSYLKKLDIMMQDMYKEIKIDIYPPTQKLYESDKVGIYSVSFMNYNAMEPQEDPLYPFQNLRKIAQPYQEVIGMFEIQEPERFCKILNGGISKFLNNNFSTIIKISKDSLDAQKNLSLINAYFEHINAENDCVKWFNKFAREEIENKNAEDNKITQENMENLQSYD